MAAVISICGCRKSPQAESKDPSQLPKPIKDREESKQEVATNLQTDQLPQQLRQAAEPDRKQVQDYNQILTERLPNGGTYWTSQPWGSMQSSTELVAWSFAADGKCRYYGQQTKVEPITRTQKRGNWRVISGQSKDKGRIEITMAIKFGEEPEARPYEIEFREGSLLIGAKSFVPCPEFAEYIIQLDRDRNSAPLPGR